MFWLHFRGTWILCRSQNPEISPTSCEQKKKLKIFWHSSFCFEAKKSTLWNVFFFKEDKTIWKLNEKNKRLQSSAMPPISNKMFYKPENWRVMVNKFHIAAFVCFFFWTFSLFSQHIVFCCVVKRVFNALQLGGKSMQHLCSVKKSFLFQLSIRPHHDHQAAKKI